ncbi:MAG: phospho-N-acetylmuramoyl-pentapeptide-transferase [Candidatus Eisenbacteria bacterium]|nr:phospho-N-acetylmuramoyl-pentapeptide-transferase [Candidatus Eisenbacteria bacterium]
MFYHLLYPLHTQISIFNVFRYITFRSAYAAATALLLTLLIGPYVIRRLREIKIGQAIRAEGPQTHHAKAGTPTMGGVLLVGAILVSTLLWGNLTNRYVQMALLAVTWLGLLGFVDDYLHVVKGVRKGLLGRYKLAAQGALGLVIGLILVLAPVTPEIATRTNVPFFKTFPVVELGLLYIPFVMIVLAGFSNAVNLSDGLDGLASGMVVMAGIALAGLSYVTGHEKFSHYLLIPYMPGTGELTVFCAALVGASLGFLWFNCHPAEVFMGDTGSLALGGALATVAILIKRELLFVVVGGLFVVEALSVMIQVGSFKWFGKRLFRMAPIHHHFELLGWPESRVVVRFWIAAGLLGLLSLTTLKLQ